MFKYLYSYICKYRKLHDIILIVNVTHAPYKYYKIPSYESDYNKCRNGIDFFISLGLTRTFYWLHLYHQEFRC